MKKKLVFVLFTMFIFTGCGQNSVKNNLHGVAYVNKIEGTGEKTTPQRVEEIKNEVLKINGIVDCAVVVEGHTAIVGLVIEDKKKIEEGHISKEVDEGIRKIDPYIETTSITSNGYILGLIRELEAR